jgi:hypothetical protein
VTGCQASRGRFPERIERSRTLRRRVSLISAGRNRWTVIRRGVALLWRRVLGTDVPCRIVSSGTSGSCRPRSIALDRPLSIGPYAASDICCRVRLWTSGPRAVLPTRSSPAHQLTRHRRHRLVVRLASIDQRPIAPGPAVRFEAGLATTGRERIPRRPGCNRSRKTCQVRQPARVPTRSTVPTRSLRYRAEQHRAESTTPSSRHDEEETAPILRKGR